MQQELPGIEVRAIRQVAEEKAESSTRVGSLMWLVTFAALFAAALVWALPPQPPCSSDALKSGDEGAGREPPSVGAFFLAEHYSALVGGIRAIALGLSWREFLGIEIFGIAPNIRLILFPVVLVWPPSWRCSQLVPLERASRVDPAPVLRGE